MHKNLLIKIAMLSILAIAFSSSIFGQIGSEILSNERVDWRDAGYMRKAFPIPTSYQHTIAVDQMPGRTDREKLKNAISAAKTYHTETNATHLVKIEFSARWYYLDYPEANPNTNPNDFFITDSNLVFVGQGINSTRLYMNINYPSGISEYDPELTADLFDIRGQQSAILANISSYNSGGNIITLNQSVDASDLDTGEYILIQAPNDTYWHSGNSDTTGQRTGWASDYMGQITMVAERISGTQYRLTDDFTRTWEIISEASNPQATYIRKLDPLKNVGFEDFSISSSVEKRRGNYFTFARTANCWLRNIKSLRPPRIHCHINNSTAIEIRNSYFYSSDSIGPAPGGYGINIDGPSTYCLIENNILGHLRHSIILQAGANRNVIGYNYLYDKAMSIGDLNLHGQYPYLNLFEGNYADYITADNYWNRNGPYNTYIRNYGLYKEDNDSMSIFIESSDDFHLIGNETGLRLDHYISGQPLSVPKTDLYGYLNPNTTVGHSNWNSSKRSTYYMPDLSYYYDSGPPSFFSGTGLVWPSIGPKTSSGGSVLPQNIPARQRACSEFGVGVACTTPPKAFVDDEDIIKSGLPTKYNLSQNFPNPFNPSTTISYALPNEGQVTLKVYDSLGKLVTTLVNDYKQAGYYNVTLNGSNLASGVYLYRITSGNFTQSKKLILLK